MPIFPKKTSAEKMYNTKKPLNYGGQSGNRKTVQKGYARINTSDMPKFKGGTAPGFSRVNNASRIIKAFFNAPKQYLRKAGLIKTTREKVTKMPESFFKNVEKQMKNNPNLKESFPGYFTFKK